MVEITREFKVEIHKETTKSGFRKIYDDPIEAAIELLRQIPEEDRMEVFGAFCVYCGDEDPRCVCRRDD